MSSIKKMSLTNWILLALAFGLLLGTFLHYLTPESLRDSSLALLKASGTNLDLFAQLSKEASQHWINFYFVDGLFSLGAEIFIRTLKMLVVPLVFVSLVCGTASLGDPKKLGRIGGKTLGLYILTTALAVTLALIAASLAGVGKGLASLGPIGAFKAPEAPSLLAVIVDMVPSNPFEAMVQGNMLQVIFFALIFGFSMSLVGDRAEQIQRLFLATNDIIMQMITLLMYFAPIGVFCVVAKVLAENGLDSIVSLFRYFFLTLAVLTFHVVAVYGGLLKFIARLSPLTFVKKIRPIAALAFSTASSNATLPLTLESVEKDFGVDNSIASFAIPLGATVNMDGTAIMQGVATVFIANAMGIDLTFPQFLVVILTATLASIGTAGVPGVGMITLAMVLNQVGLDQNYILLLLPVDRLLDMCRTVVNVTGDVVVSCLVAKSEGKLDEACFQKT